MLLACLADLIYVGPLVPIATRGALIICFKDQMREIPPEEEQDREGHRTLILAFAGFSFTGVVALIVLEPATTQSLQGAIFFLLVSFLTYLWALNLQGYKAFRWQGAAAVALGESGSLCLILALISLLVSSKLGRAFVTSASILAGSVWVVDHVTRLRIDWRFLKAMKPPQSGEATGDKAAR